MHFVGMLALQLPVPISYDLLWTLVSALVATAILVGGLYFFRRMEKTFADVV